MPAPGDRPGVRAGPQIGQLDTAAGHFRRAIQLSLFCHTMFTIGAELFTKSTRYVELACPLTSSRLWSKISNQTAGLVKWKVFVPIGIAHP